jgi:hypothetical protein
LKASGKFAGGFFVLGITSLAMFGLIVMAV